MNRPRNIFPILNAIYVFEVAARELNFTHAAQKLGMAQPSVSRFIAKLEDHLGVALFDRHRRQLALTDAGAALYAATELGLGHIRSVLEEFEHRADNKQLVIACTHGFAHMWIVPRIRHLRALLLGWDILLSTSEQPQATDFDAADIVIRFGDGNWPDAHKTPLFSEEVFPVCAPHFAGEHGLLSGPQSPGDLTMLPLIVQDHGEYGWLDWRGWFDAFGVAVPHLPEPHPVPSYHFVLQAATEGAGIALAWQDLFEPYLSNGWLVELPDMRVKTSNGYFALYSAEHPQAGIIERWLRGNY